MCSGMQLHSGYLEAEAYLLFKGVAVDGGVSVLVCAHPCIWGLYIHSFPPARDVVSYSQSCLRLVLTTLLVQHAN